MLFQTDSIDLLELSVSDSIIKLYFLLVICAVQFTWKTIKMTELGRGN